MHIAITGNLGSGKSTVCNYLRDKYHFLVYSTGKIQREIARELGLSTLEMNRLMHSEAKYDDMIDSRVAQIAMENRQSDLLFDSRMAWHFVPHAFKVFVYVDPGIAAERVYADERGLEETYESLSDARRKIAARAREERTRFKEIYHVDYLDYSNYDLIIDSSYCEPALVAEVIYQKANESFREKPGPMVLISPDSLYPSKPIGEITPGLLEQSMRALSPNGPIAEADVVAAKYLDYHIILEGHHWVAACKKRGVKLIAATVTAFGREDLVAGSRTLEAYVKANCNPSTFHDYEKAFGFSYHGCPMEQCPADDRS